MNEKKLDEYNNNYESVIHKRDDMINYKNEIK
jgi:hypothetical protein